MKTKNNNKVLLFYASLDENLKNNIINSFEFSNREEKRKFSKIKDINDKIAKMLSSQMRYSFVNHAYDFVSARIPFDFTISYDELIASINDETAVIYTIFFFRWCYEYGEDGMCNDDKYFAKFIHSSLFENIVSHKSVETETADQDNNNKNYKAANLVDKHDLQEDNTMKLLGYIEKRNTFYNFFPQYILEQDHFVEIFGDELKSLFPTEGGINLSYTYYGKSQTFLENHSVDTDADLFVKNIYFIDIDNKNLELNENDRYRCKLDVEKMSSIGDIRKIIRGSSELKIYKVVESESLVISASEFANRLIFVKGGNVIEGELVVLLYENKFYGPFEIHFRNQDNKFYIKTDANDNNYLIPYFSEEAIEKLEFEKQPRFENPHYTNFIHIIGETSYEDVITDEVLLDKIKDDISIELAATNPEEFVLKCKNSPFFSGDNNILQSRIKRLEDIISNTEVFKEEKSSIFEHLSKLYEKQSSATTEKAIQNSELFQSLQEKYNEARNKNDDNERNIQQLKEENAKLSAQINEQTNYEKSNISNEQAQKYEDRIKELECTLSRVNYLDNIEKDIDELEKEKQKLENNNDYLREKAEDLKKDINTAQNDIINAIKSGIESTAKVAFDPYISSEMLKAAEKWNNDEESKSYSLYREKVNSIKASDLSGKSIIDYIVNYVQERRAYKYNDIINIYVSIAQNFITVFSGEPGTGKTSICNIIGETLGLCSTDSDFNRFIPVSVERGWSSKRDFIGYFNPLTKKYDKSNSKVYDALMKLDAENSDSSYPLFIMLDEANLSPIEYYWADFMRLTDRSSYSDSYINIGIEHELYVPKTLRFLATINTDQTTESLSPRLIDRACIIKLPKVEPIPQPQNSKTELIPWDSFYEAFSSETELSSGASKLLKEVYELFNSFGMNVSPRIQLGIERYIRAAQNIMIEEEGAITSEVAIDYAIIQKLLPKINGLYSSYERFFDLLKQICKENHLKRTSEAIQKMTLDQERNMGYCQYFI